jgi:hypothetical protein
MNIVLISLSRDSPAKSKGGGVILYIT